jgi:hypothetical protein
MNAFDPPNERVRFWNVAVAARSPGFNNTFDSVTAILG